MGGAMKSSFLQGEGMVSGRRRLVVRTRRPVKDGELGELVVRMGDYSRMLGVSSYVSSRL
jgi:hypothetical protein